MSKLEPRNRDEVVDDVELAERLGPPRPVHARQVHQQVEGEIAVVAESSQELERVGAVDANGVLVPEGLDLHLLRRVLSGDLSHEADDALRDRVLVESANGQTVG